MARSGTATTTRTLPDAALLVSEPEDMGLGARRAVLGQLPGPHARRGRVRRMTETGLLKRYPPYRVGAEK
jgi:hypothetical protein